MTPTGIDARRAAPRPAPARGEHRGRRGLFGLFGHFGLFGRFGLVGLFGRFGLVGLFGRFGLVGLVGLIGLQAGCPPGPSARRAGLRPAPAQLAADAQALASAARRAGLAAPDALVQAYLEHFGGEPAARQQSRCAWLRAAGLTATAAAARLSALPAPGPTPAHLQAFVAALLESPRCDGGAAAGGASHTARGPGPEPPRRGANTGGGGALTTGRYAAELTRQESGHRVIRRETWALTRQGNRLRGVLFVHRVRVSTDGRKFVCSRSGRAEQRHAFLLEGQVTPGSGAITLRSAAGFVQPGPCADAEQPALACQGSVAPAPAPDAPGAPDAAGSGPVTATLRCPRPRALRRVAAPPPPGPGSGVYRWGGVVPRADGGRERVQETWYLSTRGTAVRGFYQRVSRATARAGATFACNGKRHHRRRRLYRVQGTLVSASGASGAPAARAAGPALTLREVAEYRQPSQCDTQQTSLDRYRGQLTGKGLELSWGAGTQRLRRLTQEANLAAPLSPPAKPGAGEPVSR
jgi:hypothetical protein